MQRRTFLKNCAGAAATTAFARTWSPAAAAQLAEARQAAEAIVLDPKPWFDISPQLYTRTRPSAPPSSLPARCAGVIHPSGLSAGAIAAGPQDLVERAGEHLDYVAMHMMGQRPLRQETVLRGSKYQAAPERAWAELMEMVPERVEKTCSAWRQP